MPPPPQISSVLLLPSLPPRLPLLRSRLGCLPSFCRRRGPCHPRAPSAQCCCFAPERSPPPACPRPPPQPRPGPLPCPLGARPRVGAAGEREGLHTSAQGSALATQPLQTHTHTSSRHTPCLEQRQISLRPQHTLTQTYTQILTQKRSQTATQTRTQTHPGRGRPGARAARDRPRPPAPHADTPDGVHAAARAAHPAVHGDADARRQTRAVRRGWRLEPPLANKAGGLPPPPRPAGAPAPAPPRLPWRRPLPHSPSWERLAPPGAQQQARSRSRGRAEGAPIALPGRLPGRALASLGPRGLELGRGVDDATDRKGAPSRFGARGRGGDREGAGAAAVAGIK